MHTKVEKVLNPQTCLVDMDDPQVEVLVSTQFEWV